MNLKISIITTTHLRIFRNDILAFTLENIPCLHLIRAKCVDLQTL